MYCWAWGWPCFCCKFGGVYIHLDKFHTSHLCYSEGASYLECCFYEERNIFVCFVTEDKEILIFLSYLWDSWSKEESQEKSGNWILLTKIITSLKLITLINFNSLTLYSNVKKKTFSNNIPSFRLWGLLLSTYKKIQVVKRNQLNRI